MPPPRPPGKLGLALGGGSAKGWAHIGVIRELQAAGWHPDVVAGTSIGAAMGAALASGRLDQIEAWGVSLRWLDVVAYLDLSFDGGLLHAQKVVRDFASFLPNRPIETYDLTFGAVAADLVSGREVWITRGSARAAVRASIAIPGLITAKRIQGRWLVDGGLVNPVPVSLCRALGAETVVAVDLQGTLHGRAQLGPDRLLEDAEPAAQESAGEGVAEAAGEGEQALGVWRQLRAKAAALRGQPKSSDERTPSLQEVVSRSLDIIQARLARGRLAGDPPECLIAPRLRGIGLFDFHKAEEMIAEGRRAARMMLAALDGAVPPAGPEIL